MSQRSIQMYFHCRHCLDEIRSGEAGEVSPAEYQRLSIGFTRVGLQVWCNRHDINVAHIDFEGHRHPYDGSNAGDFGEIEPAKPEGNTDYYIQVVKSGNNEWPVGFVHRVPNFHDQNTAGLTELIKASLDIYYPEAQ